MKRILCYGDSNTYGLSPEWVNGHELRWEPEVRWTRQLGRRLGDDWEVIEEGLNGRTAVFDDPTTPGRRGLDHIQICVESQLPLDLVIIMLGTNDTKPIFNASLMEVAMGVGRLARTVLDPMNYMAYPAPKVLIVSPVPLGEAVLSLPGGMDTRDHIEKTRSLAPFLKQQADMLGCGFVDLAEVVPEADSPDGVHLPADAHAAIAELLEKKIRQMFG